MRAARDAALENPKIPGDVLMRIMGGGGRRSQKKKRSFPQIDEKLEGHDNPCEISVEPIMACGFGACYGCVVPVRNDDGGTDDDFEYVKSCQEGPTFDIRDLVLAKMGGHFGML